MIGDTNTDDVSNNSEINNSESEELIIDEKTNEIITNETLKEISIIEKSEKIKNDEIENDNLVIEKSNNDSSMQIQKKSSIKSLTKESENGNINSVKEENKHSQVDMSIKEENSSKKSIELKKENTKNSLINEKIENTDKDKSITSSNSLDESIQEMQPMHQSSLVDYSINHSINETNKVSKLFNKSLSKKTKKNLYENSISNFSINTNSEMERSTMSVRKKLFSIFMPRYSSSQLNNGDTSRSSLYEIKKIEKKKKKKTTFLSLPDSVIQEIYRLVGPEYCIELKHTCSKFYKIGNDPLTIAKWLYYYYDPIVLTIPENKQNIEFKGRVKITNEIIGTIINKIDNSIVEIFDDKIKNILLKYSIKSNDLELLNNLFLPKCFNVEVDSVSEACKNRNKTAQEFINYLMEMDFILPPTTFYEACLRLNNYVINSYLTYNEISHKEIDSYFKTSEKKPFHPLVAAARSNDMDLMKNLVENIGCSLSQFGFYAFEKALSHNNLDIAKYIIDIYPQLYLNDNDMMVIVSRAAEKGRLETIKLIKNIYDSRYGRSKSTNVFRKPKILANAITASALTGQLECCVWLMEHDKYNINNEYANRILTCFITHLKGKSFLPFSYRSKFIQYLSRYPIDLKGKDIKELIKVCIKENDNETLKTLIENGIDFRYENELPLQMACGYGKAEIVKMLLEKGAVPNKNVYKALKRGYTMNNNNIRAHKDSRNIIMKLLNNSQPSRRFSLSFQL